MDTSTCTMESLAAWSCDSSRTIRYLVLFQGKEDIFPLAISPFAGGIVGGFVFAYFAIYEEGGGCTMWCKDRRRPVLSNGHNGLCGILDSVLGGGGKGLVA